MTEDTKKPSIINDVIEALDCTNQWLADRLEVPRARVENWRYKGVRVPADVLESVIRLFLRIHDSRLAPLADKRRQRSNGKDTFRKP